MKPQTCANCGKTEKEHTKETTRKNRKDVVITYCHSIEDLKSGKVNWKAFLKDKFK